MGWLSGRGCLAGLGLHCWDNLTLHGREAPEPWQAVWAAGGGSARLGPVEDQDSLMTCTCHCAKVVFS